MALVVLLVGPASGEGDLLLLAEVDEGDVDELGPVVAVDAFEQEGQTVPDRFQAGEHGPLSSVGESDALGPSGSDIGRGERVEELARRRVSTVGDQVDLQETRQGVLPVGEGVQRDLLSQEGSRLGGGEALLGLASQPPEQSVGSGHAQRQELLLEGVGQGDLIEAFQGLYEFRQGGNQALSTEAARDLAEGKQGVSHIGSVGGPALASSCLLGLWRKGLLQSCDGILSMVAAGGDQFVEDASLLGFAGVLVAWGQGSQQFTACG